MQQPRRGFNLIETAIVLGVVGMVIGGSWVAYSNYKEQRDVTQMAADILTVCDRSTRALPARLQVNGFNVTITTAQQIAMKIVPETWIKNSTITPIIGTWNNLYWATTGETYLNVMGISLSQCLRLLPILSKADANIITRVAVGTGWWTTLKGFSPPYTGSVATICDNQSNIHMEFYCAPK